jgi:hypothetical protein
MTTGSALGNGFARRLAKAAATPTVGNKRRMASAALLILRQAVGRGAPPAYAL